MIEGLFTSIVYDFLKTGGKLLFGEFAKDFHRSRKEALKALYNEFNEKQIITAFFSYYNLRGILSFERKHINDFVCLLRQGETIEKDEQFIDTLLNRIRKPYPYDRDLAQVIISRFIKLFIQELTNNDRLFNYINACRQNAKLDDILRLIKNYKPNYFDLIIDILYSSCYPELPETENSIQDKLEIIRHHPSLRYYIPLNCGETIFSRDSDIDLQNETNRFFRKDSPSLLLLGDSGSGKSTFCTYLSLKLIDDYQKDNNAPLPVLIRLGGAVKAAENDKIIEAEFERLGLSSQDIVTLKKDKELVLILDGYDELGSKKNIFSTNRLGEWKAKVIITCRTQYLDKEKNYQKLFAIKNPATNIPDPKSYKTLYIVPFSDRKVDEYLEQFSPSEESEWKDCKMYKQKITSLYNLKELSSNPLLLFIITQTLPSLLAKVEEGKIQSTFTRSMLYEEFFDIWFEMEGARLRECLIENDDFFEFAEELGYQMFLSGKAEIETKKSLFKKTSKQSDDFEKFFTSDDVSIVQARSGCPIQRVGDNSYRFMHKSFQEFCVAKKFTHEIQDDILDNLNSKLLTEEPGILQFFPDL